MAAPAASQTRQAKELTAQSRLVLDQVRNQARTAAVGAWVANEGAKIAVAASESEVRAATVALQGVSKEAQGGQRTTVDVLNSQADLISAKARLIGAQRDRVIASYTLLSAIGRLDVKTLALNTPDYLPEVHYHQVRDAWHGLRTPSGQIERHKAADHMALGTARPRAGRHDTEILTAPIGSDSADAGAPRRTG